ncbi:1 4-alpha-glucan-branching enzyme 3 chloroplastic/amyloplastic [Phtheirospermum japonicum]|uniref:1 4-alpha-glucan-branching enzyme 3 chloroplastic/amyloplastic n=1 Tax=Phtheirospermum japonicum TaxID=374723 RepID=A0A830CY66_9LAMI|nr:1 4-alpha-glucan-branching enzyme 3 chloroplastic/amyloplastic [Phtheirospermum japonicum]
MCASPPTIHVKDHIDLTDKEKQISKLNFASPAAGFAIRSIMYYLLVFVGVRKTWDRAAERAPAGGWWWWGDAKQRAAGVGFGESCSSWYCNQYVNREALLYIMLANEILHEIHPNIVTIVEDMCAGTVMLTDIVFWCLLLPFMTGENFQLPLLAISFSQPFNSIGTSMVSGFSFGSYSLLWTVCIAYKS